MRNYIVTVLSLGVATALATTPSSAEAETRYHETGSRGKLTLDIAACDEPTTKTLWLHKRVTDVTTFKPMAGAFIHNYYSAHIATITAVETVTNNSGTTGIQITAAGAGMVCTLPHSVPESEREGTVHYDINYTFAIPPEAWSNCRAIEWRLLPKMVRRNGHIRCRKAIAVARAWRKASRRRSRKCRYCNPLRVKRLRGFRCIHQPRNLICHRNQQRIFWRVRRPSKRKKPSPPPPGPLGWAEAKRTALKLTREFPIVVEKREVTWCSRLDKREIHCGVRGWNTTYNSILEEVVEDDSCSDIAHVTKKPGRFPKVHSGGARLCFYD